ncbi:MAG: serine hydrolase domain-containing protein [Actinomycetota bacterium]
MTKASGYAAPGFEAVREAFEENFEQRGEVGAACCVHVHGRVVADLWSGLADKATGRAWEEDTLQLVFSTTKGATSTCVHMLVERGLLDLDAPVADYWPEFAAAGKRDIPIRHVLSHQAGLAALDHPLSPAEVLAWHPMTEALARQKPLWEPGTKHAYHAVTYGFLTGELVRRVTGRSLGRFFAEEVAEPLGLDFWIGLPEEHEARVAKLVPPQFVLPEGTDLDSLGEPMASIVRAIMDPTSLPTRALAVSDPPLDFDAREVHAAELPASNGIGTARALSRMYAALIGEVDGIRLLDPATVERARTSQARGPDGTLIVPTNWGLGFQLSIESNLLSGPGAFGHNGLGGSLAFAHPELGIAFGYAMNGMAMGIGTDPRAARLIEAVKGCL